MECLKIAVCLAAEPYSDLFIALLILSNGDLILELEIPK